MKFHAVIFSLSLVGTLAACKSEQPAPAPVQEAASAAEPAKAQPAAAEKMPTKADPACVGAVGEAAPQIIETANGKWERNGSTVAWKEGAKADALVLGTLTDIKDGAAENLENLRKALTFFAAQKVDAIVVAGDSGETEAHLTTVLDLLAEPKVPVFIVIGNRESKTVFNKTVTAASTRHPHIFNLNQIRRVDTPAADLVSLPGYFNPDYLHAEDGCRYYDGDLKEVATIAAAADSPVVLISHGGPKQAGKDALDFTSQGKNVGDEGMTQLLTSAKIHFGIFGNVHEAGGTGADLAGAKLAAGELHAALYLNPGPADSIRWPMNDGTESTGMAGVMTIQGAKASYQVERFQPAQTAQAQ